MDRSTIIKEWLRDSGIGFLLIFGGIIVANLLGQWFQTSNSIAYTFFLCIGEIPFLWFVGKRLGYVALWELVALVALLVMTAGARMWFEHYGINSQFVFILLMTICFGCFYWLRGVIRAHSKQREISEEN